MKYMNFPVIRLEEQEKDEIKDCSSTDPFFMNPFQKRLETVFFLEFFRKERALCFR